MGILRTAARAMLAATFISAGYHAARHPERLAERAKPVTDRVAPLISSIHPSLPNDTETLVRVNGAAQVVGGLLLATGTAPRPAAALLAGTLLPTTLAGHRYWEESDPTLRATHRIHFFKNLSMLGGLLLAAVDTGGRPSLAWRAEHAVSGAADSAAQSVRNAAGSVRQVGGTVTHGAESARDAVRDATRRASQQASRTAEVTRKETARATKSVRRSAKTAKREARLAYQAARLGYKLPR